MKKIISTLLFVIGLVSIGFAQEAKELAVTNGAEELAISKTSGVYEFTMPSELTKEKIESNAKYYTPYFTVAFDEASHVATVTMVDNTMKNRYVIARLLTTCNVKFLQVGEDSHQLYDFIDLYLK